MTTRHIRFVFPFLRDIAKVTPAINHLLRRAAANSQLQTPARDQIRRPGILRHVHWVFIPHVDHAGTDFEGFGFCAYRRQQGERRAELAGKVVHTEISAIGTQLFSGHGQVDGLQQRVRCGSGTGLWRRRPVTK